MTRSTCSNTQPLEGFTATDLKSVCPSCGEFLKVLPSGKFRSHKVIAGSTPERAADMVSRMKAGELYRGNGVTGPDPK